MKAPTSPKSTLSKNNSILEGQQNPQMLNRQATDGGPINQLERLFQSALNSNFLRILSNVENALRAALKSLDIKDGADILLPIYGAPELFAAVINAGCKPVFVDITLESPTIDPACLERCISKKTKALVALHLWGHPCDMDDIVAICQAHDIKIIEVVESLSSGIPHYKGQPVGSWSDMAIFSWSSEDFSRTNLGTALVAKSSVAQEGLEKLFGKSGLGEYLFASIDADRGEQCLAELEDKDLDYASKGLFAAVQYRDFFGNHPHIHVIDEAPWEEATYASCVARVEDSVAAEIKQFAVELNARLLIRLANKVPSPISLKTKFPYGALWENQAVGLPLERVDEVLTHFTDI